MHNWAASKFLPTSIYTRSKEGPKRPSLRDKARSISWHQPKPTSASPTIARSAWTSASDLSRTSTHSNSSAGSSVSDEELDCFRSMRGTAVTSTTSLNSAMSSDAQELFDRLHSVRKAGERHKKVFDQGGQGYSILVTREEVRVCHVDEKGEYHYQHLPLPQAKIPTSLRSRRNSTDPNVKDSSANSSVQSSRQGSRATSTERPNTSGKTKGSRHQIVRDHDGRILVDITPSSVTVFHDGGVWRCHHMLGKIWDSDYATHVTARMPRAWSRRPSAEKKKQQLSEAQNFSALDADELRRAGWDENAIDDDAEHENKKQQVELLLCSNTPGERGQAPRAFKSYYHDL